MNVRTQSAWFSVAVFALILPSCKDGDESGGGSGKTTTYDCKIQVAEKMKAKPESFKGTASGEDEKATDEAAWKDVCSKLPEADQGDCRDNDKWRWSAGGGSSEVDGKKNYNKNITLTRVVKPKESSGKATSTESSDKACADARAKACEAAGAKGDCVAAGTHEERGMQASTTSM